MRLNILLLSSVFALGAHAGAQAQAAPTPAAAPVRADAAAQAARLDAAAREEAQRAVNSDWNRATLKTRDERLAWWRDARFGAFIHWGPYSVLGGRWNDRPNPGYAEHIMRAAKIPTAIYTAEVAAKFHPDQFDATEWVRQIKRAGMRYVIITAKHHDGFAIYPSGVSDKNIGASGFKRDPLRELVDAARAEKLRIGFYYSHALDWSEPDAPGNGWEFRNPGGTSYWWYDNPAFAARSERYVRNKVIPQLGELVARYKPDIFWFDMPERLPFAQQAEVVKAVRALDPNIVINGRAARHGSINLGDYRNTADRPAEIRPTEGDWEAIPTTNESYGYNALDTNHKPASHFIRLLAKAAAKGGNILLNFGPRGDGTIDAADSRILTDVGKWMEVNGASIRGTRRTPLDRQAWGDSTLGKNKLYLHVMQWPADGKLVIGGLTTDASKAYLLSDPKVVLGVRRLNAHDVEIAVARQAPDPVNTVIVLEFPGRTAGEPGRLLDSRGINQLLAYDAVAEGEGFEYGDQKALRYYMAGLGKPGTSLTWPVRGTAPATMTVKVRYNSASPNLPADAAYVLTYGKQTLRLPIRATADVRTIAEATLGDLRLETGALQPLTLRVEGDVGASVQTFELLLARKPG